MASSLLRPGLDHFFQVVDGVPENATGSEGNVHAPELDPVIGKIIVKPQEESLVLQPSVKQEGEGSELHISHISQESSLEEVQGAFSEGDLAECVQRRSESFSQLGRPCQVREVSSSRRFKGNSDPADGNGRGPGEEDVLDYVEVVETDRRPGPSVKLLQRRESHAEVHCPLDRTEDHSYM